MGTVGNNIEDRVKMRPASRRQQRLKSLHAVPIEAKTVRLRSGRAHLRRRQ